MCTGAATENGKPWSLQWSLLSSPIQKWGHSWKMYKCSVSKEVFLTSCPLLVFLSFSSLGRASSSIVNWGQMGRAWENTNCVLTPMITFWDWVRPELGEERIQIWWDISALTVDYTRLYILKMRKLINSQNIQKRYEEFFSYGEKKKWFARVY